jgi:DNA-directed RNA polymerase specialized sigma subunit
MSNTADWPGPRITVTLNGRKTYHVVDIASPHEQSIENPEDAFIEALDIKYKWVFHRDYRILEYLRMGYTQAEAGSLVGVSQGRVAQIIKKLQES